MQEERLKQKQSPNDKSGVLTAPLKFSASPHILAPEDVPKIMRGVVWALLPAGFASIYFFGFSALSVILISVAATLFFEYIFLRIFGNKGSIADGSALVTGILLAYNLPPGSPWWLVVVGAFIAVLLGKQVYGGLGYNIFNPALVARVFLLIAWPVQMTTWILPRPPFPKGAEAVTGATPLGVLKTEFFTKGTIGAAKAIHLSDLFYGKVGGSLGEVSALALLIGGGYLLYRKIISWHIPVAYVGTVFLMTGIFWLVNPDKYINPVFHILAGGLMLGALFMATDMVTSPVTSKGKLIFGVGCGIITVVIRLFGSYPEGVSYSILVMNAFTPLIDRYTKPKTFGAK
ncbi:MAG: RnfABCDGE type electron transport complex subunit D [Acidobacteria bacterium]|nr:RnfABCDGE type electron transport complex subunit D [Acidobacteriota bacterium]